MYALIRSSTFALGWAFRADPWLMAFYGLAAAQGGHLLEHVAQMVQIHALGLRGPDARGVVGALDLEWVHVTWNAAVLAAVLVLLGPYRANRWLWAALPFAAWHMLEHLVIIAAYLSTGVVGTPGLLSNGGALFGGLPLSRPDLHFLYNLVETTPLVVAFLHQVRQTGRHRTGRRLARAS